MLLFVDDTALPPTVSCAVTIYAPEYSYVWVAEDELEFRPAADCPSPK
jgi:hypothetical protein